MDIYKPTEHELGQYVQMAHYCSFKRDISKRNAEGLAHEILVKGQKPPVYICEFHASVEKSKLEGFKMPIHLWLKEVIKRK